MRLCELSLEDMIRPEGFSCTCGKHHRVDLKFLRIGSGAVEALPEAMAALGCRFPFIVCDENTKRAAWGRVQQVLEGAGILYRLHTLKNAHPEPDEDTMGEVAMAFDPRCDCILAIGSGVINDCCKVLAHTAGKPQLVVGTAPSMDGYASNSSSMVVRRAKTSLYNACPQAIIADTAIMKDAPIRMLQAGFGDMIAKYVALCEWRMTALINGEYYCEEIAAMMRTSLQKIVAAAPRMLERQEDAIAAVVEGLILSGIAMAFAQVSRPASGLEHYFSHLWDTFTLERNLPVELHGIQVGVGTVLCLKMYDHIRKWQPNEAEFEAANAAFDEKAWESGMRRALGSAGDMLIEKEYTFWHNNDLFARRQRFERIRHHWQALLAIMEEELPDTQKILHLLQVLDMPLHPGQLGWQSRDVADAFRYSRNARDKYLTSSLLWDMGKMDQMEQLLSTF